MGKLILKYLYQKKEKRKKHFNKNLALILFLREISSFSSSSYQTSVHEKTFFLLFSKQKTYQMVKVDIYIHTLNSSLSLPETRCSLIKIGIFMAKVDKSDN